MIQPIKEPALRAWLKDPCTQFFFQWLVTNHNQLKDAGLESCYNNFASEDPKIKQAITSNLGRANGIALIIATLEEMFAESHEDFPREKDKSFIRDMLEVVYGGANDNN